MDEKIYGWWLPPDVSVHGAKIDQLISVLHWFMLLLFVGWGIFFVYCLIRFRARPGHTALYTPVKAMATKYIEGGVVVIEVFLLFGLSTPVWLAYKNNVPDDKKALHVHVVAEQFAWNFHYAGKDSKFGRSDAAAHLRRQPARPRSRGRRRQGRHHQREPVPRPGAHAGDRRGHLQGRDPQLQHPGAAGEAGHHPRPAHPHLVRGHAPGHFELACAQLCGLGHYRMRADVLIDTPEDYAKWEAENAPPPQEAPAAAAPDNQPAPEKK